MKVTLDSHPPSLPTAYASLLTLTKDKEVASTAIEIAHPPNMAEDPDSSVRPHARCRAMYPPQNNKAHVYSSVSVLLQTAAPESKISCCLCEGNNGEKDITPEVRANGSRNPRMNRASRLEGYSKVRT